MSRDSLLEIEDLTVRFAAGDESSEVVRNVSFTVGAGEKLALVGESGSGKTVTALSVLQLHDFSQVDYPSGSIRFQGENLMTAPLRRLRGIRGRDIAMIFQEPMTSLNPVYPIGKQLVEPLAVHRGMGYAEARRHMVELLGRTGIPNPEERFNSFPHMLSGGQRQRVMIAMALACSPKLLIADEPTTALDVTIQAQIIELLEDLQREFEMAVLLITHNLNLVSRFADRICVMQNGDLVEQAPTDTLFNAPQHPYTKRLLTSQPQRLIDGNARGGREPLLQGSELTRHFPIKRGFFNRTVGEIKAVDDVSLQLATGETLGVVGESGSGKSTLGECLLRLQPCGGHILYKGRSLNGMGQRELRPLRSEFQVVFQDPYSSLSPRMTIEQIVGEGLKVHAPQLDREQRRERVQAALEEVGLAEDVIWRYPHEFSGGQRQRIAIARVVVLQPKLILLDEPTSALDVSVQKQVLELLVRLQRDHGMSYLFISHDLKVIRSVCHRLLVMKEGRVVEAGETERLFRRPRHPYTRKLLEASLFAD